MSKKKDKIKNEYEKIKNNISDTISNINNINISNKKGKEVLELMQIQLKEIDNEFKENIDFLEKNSEWDKFVISFFGETGAGKSTIIESLKILFNENKRLKKIKDNKDKFEILESNFVENTDELLKELSTIIRTIEEDDMKSSDKLQDLETSIDLKFNDQLNKIKKLDTNYKSINENIKEIKDKLDLINNTVVKNNKTLSSKSIILLLLNSGIILFILKFILKLF